ncbi:MAG: methyltransferase [Woeseia sp.]|nr:methyltransferase [Woeseia sp.]|tara:strand:- start:5223 stop:5888 length:666 start_codon:yes stop_codon:yes gene_type:complete
MNTKKTLDLDDAYAVETPSDNIRLYDQWAPTYDDDFVDQVGYVYHKRVAEQLAKVKDSIDGAVLDIGCGTGVVGACLHEHGLALIDGIDISTQMLTEAAKKKGSGGESVYRKLIQADLTMGTDIIDDSYAGLMSAGTFTHGHLGVEPLDELWRIAAPGAQCAVGVRTTHFMSAGFKEKLSADARDGKITVPDLIKVNLYSGGTPTTGHANDEAFIVCCQVL